MSCCNGLSAGKLRNTINIQRFIANITDAGGCDGNWETYATIRAYMQALSGSERLKAMRLESKTTHKFSIRYRDDITAANRIEYFGRIFNILYVLNLEEKNMWLEIGCEEGTNGDQ